MESICPKGWTLPSKVQTDSISEGFSSATYIPDFSPVLGGYYSNSTLYSKGTDALWWDSTAYDGVRRHGLYYYDGELRANRAYRHSGYYIRCVSEEKDVSDLTYMQDMTPSIAANTAEGATASLTDRRDGKVYTVAKINGNMWMTQSS